MDDQSPTIRGVMDSSELLMALDTPALIVDSDGVILHVNSAVQSLCESSGGSVKSGAPLSQLLPGIHAYWPSGTEPFDTGCGVECEEFEPLVRVRGAPLCSRTGAPAGWLVLLQPESEGGWRSAQRLRSLLASMDDLVLVMEPDGRIIEYHDPEGGNVWLPSRHRAVGQHFQDVLPDRLARTFSEVMEIVRQTGQPHKFDHLALVDGVERWYSAHMGLLRDPDQGAAGFLAVARNITQRKRFETAEREQRVLAEALQDVALALNSTLNLDEIWMRILTNVVRVVPADAAAIMLVEHGVARVVGERGYSERGLAACSVGQEVEVAKLGRLRHMTETRQPCLIPDTRVYINWALEELSDADGAGVDRHLNWARSYLGAPIVLDEDVIGFIKLESAGPNYFTPRDVDRLAAFGAHAASAIRNARLYAQAQELAALEERQRLARDLHDAVSQMLFSAKIIAEMLPRLRDRDPDSVWTYLPELQRLIQGAMGEMRMLLMELRPAILTDVDLSVLLGYLVDAAGARTSAQVSLTAQDLCPVPQDVQIGLYRIAQEALTNAVKHAHASTIDVSVRCCDNRVSLRVADDGTGFDGDDVRPENLGLDIMRERAEELHADLRVDSVLRSGTVVEVSWPARDGYRDRTAG